VPPSPEVPLWTANEDDVIATESPWRGEVDLDRMEFRLVYLMEAHARLETSDLGQSEKDAIAGDLSEVMTSLFVEAAEAMESKPNPFLLSKMLIHYDRFMTGSASEWLGEVVERMEGLDARVTRHARKISGR